MTAQIIPFPARLQAVKEITLDAKLEELLHGSEPQKEITYAGISPAISGAIASLKRTADLLRTGHGKAGAIGEFCALLHKAQGDPCMANEAGQLLAAMGADALAPRDVEQGGLA